MSFHCTSHMLPFLCLYMFVLGLSSWWLHTFDGCCSITPPRKLYNLSFPKRNHCSTCRLSAEQRGFPGRTQCCTHIRCLRQNLDGERTLNGRSLIQRWPLSDSNGEEKQTRIYLKTSRVITLNLELSLYSNNISGEIPCALCWLPAPATL